jgi:ParB-like chromosome segregation protein Spo0J
MQGENGEASAIASNSGNTNYRPQHLEKRSRIRAAIEANPNASNTYIAKLTGTARDTVISVKHEMKAGTSTAPAGDEAPADQVPADDAKPVSYQVMPALTDEEFAALKADIKERGVMVPVEYDEFGNVLDGHHRVRACEELGITGWPRLVRNGLSDEEKRAHARALNLVRRHLTQAQRRELIASQLIETPEQSDRKIGEALGVDNKTVGTVRSGLVAREEIPHVETRIDTKGRKQPAKKPKTEKPKRTAYANGHDTPIANAVPAGDDQASEVSVEPAPAKPFVPMNPSARWLCDCMRDFERGDYAGKEPTELVAAMNEHMKADTMRIAPAFIAFLRTIIDDAA